MRVSRIKRYYSALSRYHASNGYGIHSPFAFNFVLKVLRERLPYYSYTQIERTRKTVINALREKARHPRIISTKNAKLLFRVTNYFNPQQILLLGTNYGVSTESIMSVSSTSAMTLYEPNFKEHPIADSVIAPYIHRIEMHSSITDTISSYKEKNNAKAFILINSLPDESYTTVSQYLTDVIAEEGVIIFRNLTRSTTILRLWNECKENAKYGMTFSNEKISILIINPKLPRQDFLLWF